MALHTLKEISKATGLNISFIRKCLNYMQPLLEPYQKRGINNSIMLDDSGLIVFQQIGQLKAEGLTVTDIFNKIKKMGLTAQTGKASKPVVKPAENNREQPLKREDLKKLFAELEHERRRFFEEKEKRLEIEASLRAIQSEIRLLLPPGKSIEQARHEQAQMRVREAAFMGRLDAFRQRTMEEKEKRLEAEASLKVLKAEIAQLLPPGRDIQEAKSKLRAMQLRRTEILAQLENLGFWGRKKKKSLIQELKALELEMIGGDLPSEADRPRDKAVFDLDDPESLDDPSVFDIVQPEDN